MKKNSLKLYTVPEFAEALRVHVNTVYKMIRCGRLQAFKAGHGKKAAYRIREDEVSRMLEFDAKALIDKIVDDKMKKIKQ